MMEQVYMLFTQNIQTIFEYKDNFEENFEECLFESESGWAKLGVKVAQWSKSPQVFPAIRQPKIFVTFFKF